eukprot:12936057-Heterocapsa_arctica.AAC.1
MERERAHTTIGIPPECQSAEALITARGPLIPLVVHPRPGRPYRPGAQGLQPHGGEREREIS